MKSRILKSRGKDNIEYPIDKICKTSTLLTPQQEIELGRKVKALFKVLNELKERGIRINYSNSIINFSNKDLELYYSKEQIKEYNEIINQGIKARNLMVEKNMRLVCSIASSFSNSGLSFEDLRQEGALGLQKGIDRFDPEKGCRLSTYITCWIKQAIINALNEYSKTIRLPVHVTETLLKEGKIRTKLEQKLRRPPTDEEVVDELYIKENVSITTSKLRFLRQRSKVPVSLYEPISEEYSDSNGDYLLLKITDRNTIDSNNINENYSPEYFTLIANFREDLRKEIEKLPEVQKKAVIMSYGLEGQEPKILDDIAAELKVTRDKARSTLCLAINTLRKNSKSKLIDYALADEI